ncbi:unnamed protein product [Hymenolepis diminuta]|uniref:Uncharacterized protein n=1 Tax=Hymenolepis diminuta TaxID=6216 RepID=A0A564Z8G1_HYMDI|nr:unnamed protein product [Hymenolepis diminuta]
MNRIVIYSLLLYLIAGVYGCFGNSKRELYDRVTDAYREDFERTTQGHTENLGSTIDYGHDETTYDHHESDGTESYPRSDGTESYPRPTGPSFTTSDFGDNETTLDYHKSDGTESYPRTSDFGNADSSDVSGTPSFTNRPLVSDAESGYDESTYRPMETVVF